MWALVTIYLVAVVSTSFIEAAPRPGSYYGPLAQFSNYEELDSVNRKPTRTFDVLKLGGGYGVAKRYALQSKGYETRSEKHRRGPMNGLLPGGAFGRAARTLYTKYENGPAFLTPGDNNNYEKIRKLLKFNSPSHQLYVDPMLYYEPPPFDLLMEAANSKPEKEQQFDGQPSEKAFIEKINSSSQENTPFSSSALNNNNNNQYFGSKLQPNYDSE